MTDTKAPAAKTGSKLHDMLVRPGGLRCATACCVGALGGVRALGALSQTIDQPFRSFDDRACAVKPVPCLVSQVAKNWTGAGSLLRADPR